jgi:hypothetical protein
MFPDGRTADDDYRGLVDFNRELDAQEEPGLLSRLLATGRLIGREAGDMLSQGGMLNPGRLVDPSVKGVVEAGDFVAEMVDPIPPLDRSIEAFADGRYADAALEGYTAIPMGGIFAGAKAKTANLGALNRAQELAEAGADRRAIWDETGWFKGADGQWRFEIDDSGARFQSDIVGERNYGSGAYSDAVSHPELYRAYPDLADIDTRVEITPRPGGSYLRPENREHLGLFDIAEEISASGQASRHTPNGVMNPLLHEGQHAIQSREGFARGGNISVAREMSAEPMMGDIQALQDYISNTRRAVNSAGEIGPFERSQLEMIADAERELAGLQSRVAGKPPTAFEAYRRLAGETEARNVETRRDFTPEQRRAQAPWETQDVPDDLQIVRMGGDGPQMSVEPPRIRAYHGSPHDFDRFDLSKIGTGEGAQAYGHGLYFAEAEGVARGYRDSLASTVSVDGKPLLRNNARVGSTGDSALDDLLISHNGDLNAAIADVKAHMATLTPAQIQRGGYAEELAKLESLGGRVDMTNTGRMYEVDINADPARFLDWDAPLNRQSPEVQDALRRGPGAPTWRGEKDYFDRFPSDLDRFGNDMGGDAYRRIAGDEFGQDMAAGALRESGIPGIKYRDDGSRNWRINTDDGIKWEVDNSTTGEIREFATRDEAAKFLEDKVTRNFVVFDDSLITILRKYGVASLAALPAGVLAGMGLDAEQAADMDANRAY